MTAKYTRRRVLALGAGAAGAVLLGCSGEDRPEPSAPVPAATGAVQVRQRPTGTGGARNGSLRLGRARSSAGADGLDDVSRQFTYSRLVGLDPRTAAVYGDLASAVEIVDPLTVRFSLRPSLFFHPDVSGQAHPLIAQTVMEDFERRKAEGVFLFADVIESATASSDTDLTLTLRAPFSLLFEFLARPDASIRRSDAYEVIPGFRGSGAFHPVLHSDTETVFQANPLLNGAEAPRLQEIRIRWMDQDLELDSLFAQGEIDLREHPDRMSRDAVAGVGSRVEVSRSTRQMRGIAFSQISRQDGASSIEAFRDARVRRAFAFSLNHTTLRELDGSVLSGPVNPAFAGDAIPGAELASHPLYSYNPEGAAALLRAAGQEGVAVRLSHPDTPALHPIAEAIAAQANAVGFTVRLVSRSPQEFETAFLGGDFESAFFELSGLVTPDVGLRLHTTGGVDGSGSPWGYSNPVYDAQVRDALSEINPGDRARRSRDAQRALLEAVPAMFPLNAPVEYASLTSQLGGFEFDAYEFNAGTLAANWSLPPEVDLEDA